MAHIRRLTDSCVLVSTDDNVTLFDPGFHTYQEGSYLDTLDDVTRVMITHRHGDHLSVDFVSWLTNRRKDLVVYSNDDVAGLLTQRGVEVVIEPPDDVVVEDVLHGRIPNGDQPPNRSFTIADTFTHPGDSREPTSSAKVLALPLIVPWDSTTGAVEFARRVKPEHVVPIHDFYLSSMGRSFIRNMVQGVLADDGIEVVDLDWGEGFSV